jgi:hypothetical protein
VHHEKPYAFNSIAAVSIPADTILKEEIVGRDAKESRKKEK